MDEYLCVVQAQKTNFCVCFFFAGERILWRCEGRLGRSGVCLSGKKEGDGSTPSGVYAVGNPFGIRPVSDGSAYHVVGPEDYWDCDPYSPSYNSMVVASSMPDTWNRRESEHLIDFPGVYDYVLPIQYNIPAIAGKGSAIFLHCLARDGGATAGCVALPEDRVRALIPLAQKLRIFILPEGGFSGDLGLGLDEHTGDPLSGRHSFAPSFSA